MISKKYKLLYFVSEDEYFISHKIEQVQDAIKLLKPVIPLSFITMRLAFKVPGSDYGGVHRIVRESIKKEEWLSDGSWVCVVEVPGGMKNELISQVAQRSSEVSVKELD